MKGDVYQSMADEDIWLTTDTGDRLVQDFGMFDVSQWLARTLKTFNMNV